jgi:hypothetical protein
MNRKDTDYIAGLPWKSLDSGLFKKLLEEKQLKIQFNEIIKLSEKIKQEMKEMGKNKLHPPQD